MERLERRKSKLNWREAKNQLKQKFGTDESTSKFIDFARADGLTYQDILEYFDQIPLKKGLHGQIDFEKYNQNLYGE